jgi:hypothetical protein
MSDTCSNCRWYGEVCYGAGSPNKGQPTQPTDTCGAHQHATFGRQPPSLQVVAVEGMRPDQAVLIGSISTCPGDTVPCPVCLGVELFSAKCSVCGYTGRVGLAKKQPGIVRLINLEVN